MAPLSEKIAALKASFTKELNEATTADAVEAVRIRYLGRNGLVTELMHLLKDLFPPDQKAGKLSG